MFHWGATYILLIKRELNGIKDQCFAKTTLCKKRMKTLKNQKNKKEIALARAVMAGLSQVQRSYVYDSLERSPSLSDLNELFPGMPVALVYGIPCYAAGRTIHADSFNDLDSSRPGCESGLGRVYRRSVRLVGRDRRVPVVLTFARASWTAQAAPVALHGWSRSSADEPEVLQHCVIGDRSIFLESLTTFVPLLVRSTKWT